MRVLTCSLCIKNLIDYLFIYLPLFLKDTVAEAFWIFLTPVTDVLFSGQHDFTEVRRSSVCSLFAS